MADSLLWCDEHLPELYDPGMFDEEETHVAVWEAVETLLADTVLNYLDDPDERDTLHEELTEAAQSWFRFHHTLYLESLVAAPPTALLSRPQTSQHSADWYAQRSHRLTASEFSQILDGRRGALLRSKLAPPPVDEDGNLLTTAPGSQQHPIAIAQPDGEMSATLWGHRFESVTRAIYEQELAGAGTVNDTLGRFQHQVHPWLSASPDGVVISGPRAGRLVEIKSPKTRQPGEFVPTDYYAQMQVQMEVCDADAVDFVEAQFAQRPVFHYLMSGAVGWTPLSDADLEAVAAAHWKGRIQVYGFPERPSTWVYRYTAPVEDLDDAAAAYLTPPPPATDPPLPLLEESIWWLTGFYPRTVLRNPTWWSETGWPAASQFWAEVESLRDDPAAAAAVLEAANTRITVIKEEAAVPDDFLPLPPRSAGAAATAIATDDNTITLIGDGGWKGRF
jgi:hypothetical protein